MGRVKAEKVSLATRAERLAKIKVEEINGVLCTTSLNVAEVFGKEHSNIIKLVDNVIKKWVEMGLVKDFGYTTYFIESTYVDAKGETRRMYLLTKEGIFIILLGGKVELALYLLKTLDVSNIFEALGGFIPSKPVIPYYLYLLQSGNTNVYKIGIAKDVGTRMKNITHHDVLKLVESWEFDAKEECRDIEKAIHKALHEYKANKEWFYLSEDNDKSVEIINTIINTIGT